MSHKIKLYVNEAAVPKLLPTVTYSRRFIFEPYDNDTLLCPFNAVIFIV